MQKVSDVQQKLEHLAEGSEVNLVLSGGGMKGVAHLPLLEYLESRKITIKAISGTSAGAVVGVMYASGLTPKEILQFFIDHPLFRYKWIRPGKGGVFNTLKYIEHFEGYVKHSFEELDIPVHICSTNLEEGIPQYFNSGKLMHKLIASCAVPGIYTPVELNGQLFGDGGVMDNYPIQPFSDSTIPIIGSFLRTPGKMDGSKISSTRQALKRSVYLQRTAIEIPKFAKTHLSILHELNDFSAFKQKDAFPIYQYTKNKYFNSILQSN